MNAGRKPDWNPHADSVRSDQIAAYDEMRGRCPVAYSESLHYSFFRHADVMHALLDHATFSNAVSSHVSVPNGMDPPEHAGYRRIIDPYFSAERMAALEPACRDVAVELIQSLPQEAEIMSALAEPFALRAQCAFLDWPVELQAPLREWVRKNHEATRTRDRAAMIAVAAEFDGHIRQILASRRPGGLTGSDIASRLLREQVRGRQLLEEEIVSILRNWTVGELATIAACVGILARYLAGNQSLQSRLREAPELLPAAIDEILRIDPPLIASRRITTKPVHIGGCPLELGERVTLMWASANRDEAVFGVPDELRLDRNPALNLLYGAGVHVCPGAPLARMELRVLMEELLSRTSRISTSPIEAVRAVYPAAGFASVHLRIDVSTTESR